MGCGHGKFLLPRPSEEILDVDCNRQSGSDNSGCSERSRDIGLGFCHILNHNVDSLGKKKVDNVRQQQQQQRMLTYHERICGCI